MRTIPAAAQTLLEQDLGTEIIIVLEVMWAGGVNSRFYADRTIVGTAVQGKILQLSGLDEAVLVSGGGQSQQISVTLDDTDGDIKTIFDGHDVHKAPVRVWFFIAGTSFATDKFSVFLGQINSPFEWHSGLRQVSFSVVNRIEDVEIGFSAEEGQFPHLPEDLIGKPWPLCFGTTINIPALKAVPAISGTLARGVGIKDFTLNRRLALAEDLFCPRTPIGFRCFTQSVGAGLYQGVCNIAYETDQACVQAKCVEIERLKLQLQEQSAYEFSTITVFGGANFPQGRRITLNINGGLFTGSFQGTPTNPSNVFRITSRRHPLDNGKGQVKKVPEEDQIRSLCPGSADAAQDTNTADTVFGEVYTGLRDSRNAWEKYRAEPSADFFWAGGGQTVTLQDASELIYIANIVPSTILRVAAWRTVNGNRFLLTVPDEFFTVRQTDYNGYQVMEIVFQRPLSTEQQDKGGGWSDDIYITQISSVGPNPVDIIEWFIDTYTSYSKDAASFADVRAKIDTYSMHFPLLVRKNLITVLQELATQARCALWQRDDTFFIKYLSEEPSTVATITEDDVLEDSSGNASLRIELTTTEDIVTKLTANWKKDYALDEDNRLILRHNVVKYGTQERTVDYYAYHHLDWVRKTATYWLIRWSNTWKRIHFSTSLEFMKLEPFDAVTFNLPDVASSPFTGIIERAEFDSDNKQINFEAWTPVRAGEMAPYNFAWPAAISENALFPTIEARNLNQAGSGKEPNFSVIAPPGHPLETSTSGIYQGINLGCNGAGVVSLEPGVCRQDHGDRNPSDIGDQVKTVDVAADQTGAISGGTSPITNGAGFGWWSKYQDGLLQRNKTEQDAARGREVAQRGADASGANDNTVKTADDFRDLVEGLPDPDDLDPNTHPCQVRVTMKGFKTVKFQLGCVPDSEKFTEILVFNSYSTAIDFCASFNANSKCNNAEPCGYCAQCFVSTVVGDEPCEPEDPSTKGMIGYRKTGLGAGDDTSLFL